eukprot:COSAG02_NODE_23019_length_732_cov_1.218009_1_plen_43_part_01
MGRKVHLGACQTENIIDTFGYTPSPFVGNKDVRCAPPHRARSI